MTEQRKVPFQLVITDGNPYRTRCIRAFKSALALYGYDYVIEKVKRFTKLIAQVYEEDCQSLYDLYFNFGGV